MQPTLEVERAAERARELEERFTALRTAWKDGTFFESSLSKIESHPAYRDIVALGPDVVPLIIDDLRTAPNFWFAALEELTGEDPVTPEMVGKVAAMSKAWVEWYDRSGVAD